jgi:hypothetical protein
MKTISPGILAATPLQSAGAVSSLVAGCGGSSQFANATAQATVGDAITSKRVASPGHVVLELVGSDTFSTERLTGTAKLGLCKFRTRFRAKGVAGPNPGTFTATGVWGIDFPTQVWFFHELFVITSGSQTIHGHIDASGSGSAPFLCTAVKNDIFPYSTPMVSGNTKINVSSAHFHEGLLSF